MQQSPTKEYSALHERIARYKKHNALLVLALRSRLGSEDLILMSDKEWVDLAACAKVIPPSRETRSDLIESLLLIETPLETAAVSEKSGYLHIVTEVTQ